MFALVLSLVLASGASAETPPEAPADTAASVRWTAHALGLWRSAAGDQREARGDAARGDSTALRALRPLPPAARLWTLLALAQHDASGDGEAAVVGASAEALRTLLPTDLLRQRIGAHLARETATLPDTTGLARGRALARQRLAEAPRDTARWDGKMPGADSLWRPFPGTTPEGAAVPGYATWVLDSADQFRPPPPPAFGSAAFEAALEEVRAAARGRTAHQRRRARFWALRNGATEWARRAAELLAREAVPDPEASGVLAALQVSLYDAYVACWDGKYHYWTIRPEQADSTITRPFAVSLPNFPSYPSGHACAAGAAETVLGAALPEASGEVQEAAWEMAESRLWGGVHYRFDNDAGLDLGRAVANLVLARGLPE